MPDQDEQEWMTAFKKGDDGVFTQLYDHYFRPLCYFSYKLTGNMPQSEDIASVSLSKLWGLRQNFDHPKSIKGFLYTTARNASIDYLKSSRIRSAAATELLPEEVENEDEIMTSMLEAQLLKHIYDSVEALPDRAKEVFKMIFLEGLSTDKIAEKLDLPVQTVRNNKTRAIELLKVMLLKKNILPSFISYLLLN